MAECLHILCRTTADSAALERGRSAPRCATWHDSHGRWRRTSRGGGIRHGAPAATASRRQTSRVGPRLSVRSPSFARRPLDDRAMIAPARVAAYKILRAVSSGRADLPTAIEQARAALPDARDRALATEIATGAVRWLAGLAQLIAARARRPVNRLDPEVVDILRLSAYQLLHLTRVPASAVVDDAVDLARRS